MTLARRDIIGIMNGKALIPDDGSGPPLVADFLPIYLYFGYLPIAQWPVSPDCAEGGRPAAGAVPPASLPSPSRSHLIEEGVQILRRVFRESIRPTDAERMHVLPLSGGLDSRAILGGLLENLDSRRIQAVTFGVPGTWDFEIGQQVARAAGVRCATIDLSAAGWVWDTGELVETARQTERPTKIFDAHVNRRIPERFGTENVYWSGFLGEALTGAHLLSRDSVAWDQARRRFAERQRLCLSVALAPPGFEPERALPPSPVGSVPVRASKETPDGVTTNGGGLCYDDQLDFGVRQPCLIRPIVLPPGYEYRTPFLDPEWVNFLLSVPRWCRREQYLYKEILKAVYPRLFSLPVKNNLGLPLNAPRWRKHARWWRLGARGLVRRIAPGWCHGIAPGLNYVDFDQAIRWRKDLRAVIRANIQDLQKRGVIPWMDIEALERRHQRGYGNHADALLLLTSLEIYLKVQDSATASRVARRADPARSDATRAQGPPGGTTT